MDAQRSGASDDAGPRIVLHADDFGMSPAVTDGILQGFDQGLLTSTSLMAGAPDAARALEQWKHLDARRRAGQLPSAARRRRLGDPDRPFDLGIHLNLTQGRPLTADAYPAELLDTEGRFPGVFGLFGRLLRRRGARLAAAVKSELAAQVQFVLDHGLRPTHLNGHQYVEMMPGVARIVPELLAEFQIGVIRVGLERCWLPALFWPGVGPVKWAVGGVQTLFARRFRARMARWSATFPDAYFGTLTAGRTDMRMLRAFLARSRRFRLSEIAVHPALPSEPGPNDDGWQDPLAQRRPEELRLMMSDQLDEQLERFQLKPGRLQQ